uniref:Link domain-containing protein n=1 Tax=Astyanax mexicanus TaxID=7994 RepID=A0A8B9JGG5_ASTMX
QFHMFFFIVWMTLVLIILNIRSSYAGVVHLEGSGRYSLNYQQAKQLCQNLGYSLATEEQITEAYNHGLKTCRLEFYTLHF